MKLGTILQLTVLICAVLFGYWYNTSAPHIRHREPLRSSPHPYHYFEELFSEAEIQDLFHVMRSGPLNMTTKSYTDNRFDNIGEKVPVDQETGECPSALLTKTKDGKFCVFPERIDVAFHQLLSGGYDARKESYSTTVKRLVIFQKFFQQAENTMSVKAVNDLFQSDRYMQHTSRICGSVNPILEPMTLTLLVSLPGQFVGIHIDIPWFEEANRYDLPGWLLAVMQASGLFRESRIPQVQGVYYLHRWTDTDKRRGNFFFYANGTGTEPLIAKASHNNAIICDGTEMAHGTQTYIPEAEPAPIDKESSYSIEYRQPTPDNPNPVDGGDPEWVLRKDGEIVRTYRESELRMTLVWRQHCFENEAARDEWNQTVTAQQEAFKVFREYPEYEHLFLAHPKKDNMEIPKDTPRAVRDALKVFGSRLHVEDVLEILAEDLIRKGVITERPKSHQKFVLTLIDHYLAYPFPQNSWFPYNLCALEGLLPKAVRPVAQFLCG